MTRVHNFLVHDADACAVFFSESVQAAGLDSALKLARLLLISLFLCYQSAVELGGWVDCSLDRPAFRPPAKPAARRPRHKPRH